MHTLATSSSFYLHAESSRRSAVKRARYLLRESLHRERETRRGREKWRKPYKKKSINLEDR
jgi:hypothetical protein